MVCKINKFYETIMYNTENTAYIYDSYKLSLIFIICESLCCTSETQYCTSTIFQF